MLYDDIADTVIRQAHKLPEHLAPQPECVEHHCLRCVRRWGEKKADGFTCSWTEISLGCEREIRYAKCSHCKELGQKCLEAPSEYRRAMNILTALIKNCEATTSPTGVSAACLDDLRKYAYKLGESVKRFEARGRKGILAAGGMKEWAHARQVSMEHNLIRYKDGLGGVGLMAPTNEVVDEAVEQGILGNLSNRDKRWYWYGSGAK